MFKYVLYQIFCVFGLTTPFLAPTMLFLLTDRRFSITLFIASSIIVMPFTFMLFDLVGSIVNLAGMYHATFAFQAFYLLIIFFTIFAAKLQDVLWPYILILSISLLIAARNEINIVSIIANARSLLLLPVCILCVIRLDNKYRPLMNKLIYFSVCSAVIINLFFISLISIIGSYESFFSAVGYDQMYLMRNFTWEDDLPIGFKAYDMITGNYVIRFVGLFSSPDKLAYLLCALIFLAYSKFHYTFILLLGLVTLTLLHVKVLVLLLIVFIICKYTKLLHRNTFGLLILGLTTSVIAAIFIVLNTNIAALSKSGALHHIWGLYVPFQNAKGIDLFIGHGLGTGGTIGRTGVVTDALKAELGGESFIGSLFYQGGFMSLAAFYVVWRKIFNELKNVDFEAGYVLIAVVASYYISEASASFFQSFMFTSIISVMVNNSVKRHGR